MLLFWRFKRPRINLKARAFLVAVMLFLAMAGAVSYILMRHAHQVAAQQLQTNDQQLQKTTADSAAKALQLANDAASSPTTSATNNMGAATPTSASSNQSSASTKSEIRYAISSDPRSTDYSLAPPAPNPASFDIAITHAGQIAAGTVISYNATKNERTIYGGDLIINNRAFDYSNTPNIGENDDLWFQAIVPDGAIVSLPGLPYNAPAGGFWASGDSAASAASFNMMLNPSSRTMAPGTYIVHLVTNRLAANGDDYEYDGFISVDVTD